MRSPLLLGVVTVVLFPTTFGWQLNWCNITQGYSFTTLASPSALPSSAVTVWARSDIECVAKCFLRQLSCLQMYYNVTTGVCYFISSIPRLSLSVLNGGKYLTTPSPVIGNELCNVNACPGSAVCVGHCSSQYGGPKCLIDHGGCPQSPEILNVRYYYQPRYEDDTDSGIVQVVNYSKLSNATAIRVRWLATIRTSLPASTYCARYYVTFNGLECKNASAIDLVVSDGFGVDYHAASEIDGLCYGVMAGTIQVAINVGPCPGYILSDSYTGWGASRSMWIWEMNQATKPTGGCGGSTYVNTQQSTLSRLNIQSTADGMNPDVELTAITFAKYSNSSYISIKWFAAVGLYSPNNASYCARWYATVNGSECAQKVDFTMGMFENSTNGSLYNYKTRSLEGICSGLLIGIYRVAIMVGACYQNSAQPYTVTSCCGNASRLIVNELWLGSRYQAVKTPAGSYLLLSLYNRAHWIWSPLNSLTSSGTATSTIFMKWTGASDLHVRAVGQRRVLGAGGCCRWYVTIDGQECSQPGPIESVHYTGRMVNYSSQGIVDGVCYGYAAGAHTMQLRVAPCSGFAAYQCATGLGSTFHVIVEEAHLEQAATCASPLSCP